MNERLEKLKNVNGLHKNTQFIFGKGLPVYNVEHNNRTRRYSAKVLKSAEKKGG